MTDRANATQHGGDWYRTTFQHWDLIEHYGIGYLEAAASKYVTRWRKKGTPRLDLDKALHYTRKLIELHFDIHRLPRGVVPARLLEAYAEANQLTDMEDRAVSALCRWAEIDDLHRAVDAIQALLRECDEMEKPE